MKNRIVPEELLNCIVEFLAELTGDDESIIEMMSIKAQKNYKRIWEILEDKVNAMERRQQYIKNNIRIIKHNCDGE